MAKKFGKFLAFTAVVGAACGAVYYILGKKDDESVSFADDDSSDFFVNNNDREYVSLNGEAGEAAEAVKEAAEELKDTASETKEVIMNKLNEAAEELKEKAQEAADGVGLVKGSDDKDTVEFEFENLATEED